MPLSAWHTGQSLVHAQRDYLRQTLAHTSHLVKRADISRLPPLSSSEMKLLCLTGFETPKMFAGRGSSKKVDVAIHDRAVGGWPAPSRLLPEALSDIRSTSMNSDSLAQGGDAFVQEQPRG